MASSSLTRMKVFLGNFKIWLIRNHQTLLAMAILIAACAAIMWPRLRSTQFGLLDDGVTIKMAQALSRDPLKAFTFMGAAGRFLPSYWFTEILIYRWAGIASLRWFYVNLLFLILDTVAIFWIVRFRGGTILQSVLAGLLLCLSSPIVETFYTISKPDLIMVSWMIWGIFFVLLSWRFQNVWVKRGLILSGVFCFGMSFSAKEPALAFIGIALGWFIVARFVKSLPEDVLDFKATRTFLFSVLVSLIVYLILRFSFVPANPLSGTYSSSYQLSIESISDQLLRWLGRIARDFLYLLPLGLVLINSKARKLANTRLLLDSLVWMLGWMVIYLPWNVLESFHTFAFSVGVAIIGGICAGSVIEVLFRSGVISDRVYISLVLILTLFVGQFTFVNNISTARVQLFYDDVNNRMVKFLARSEPGSSFFFNTPMTEYSVEVNLHLQLFRDRNDLSVENFEYQRPLGLEPVHYYVVNPVMDNAPLPSVRNSLHESGVFSWSQCFLSSLNPRNVSPVYEGVQKLRWVDFGINRLLGLLGIEDKYSFTITGRPFIDSKEMSYGWQVYEIQMDPAQIAFPGGYNGVGEWHLETPNGKRLVSNFGVPGELPLTGDFNGDGKTDIGSYTPATHQLSIDLNLDGKPDQDIVLSNMRGGDSPLVGDWDGDGIDTPGFYHPDDSSWHFMNEKPAGYEDEFLVTPLISEIVPLAGDWDGDGDDAFGFYYPSTGDVYLMNSLDPKSGFEWAYRSEPDATPVVGNWYGFGRDTLAFVKDSNWSLRPNNVSCEFPNPIPSFSFGDSADIPVGGIW